MDRRFEYVVAATTKELVEELNRRAERYHFSVIYMNDSVAVIDTVVNPVVIISDEDFETVPSDLTPINPSFA